MKVALRDGRTVTGRVTNSDDTSVSLDVEGGDSEQVALADVAKAKVQVEFNRKES